MVVTLDPSQKNSQGGKIRRDDTQAEWPPPQRRQGGSRSHPCGLHSTRLLAGVCLRVHRLTRLPRATQ